MSQRPIRAPHRQPGQDRNADLRSLSADELAVVAAGCDYLASVLWQRARMDHAELDRLLERQNAALRLLGKARHAKGQAALPDDPGVLTMPSGDLFGGTE